MSRLVRLAELVANDPSRRVRGADVLATRAQRIGKHLGQIWIADLDKLKRQTAVRLVPAQEVWLGRHALLDSAQVNGYSRHQNEVGEHLKLPLRLVRFATHA